MNKRFVTLLTGAVAALSLASCQKGNANVKEYDFSGTGYTECDYLALKTVFVNMSVGEKKSLEVDTYPSSYSLNELQFTSLNNDIAAVSQSGEVTAKSNGIVDIVVSSKDGLYSNKVRVTVSAKSTKSGCQSVLDTIDANYKSETYSAPTKVLRYEYSNELYFCEGVLDHGLEGYEALGYDSKTGYFFIDGPAAYYKTPYGDPEVSDGKWIFHPINNGQKTRLIHITPTLKTFFEINTANYGKNHDQRIRHVLDLIFVSGEEILDNLFEDYEGLTDFNDFPNYDATQYYSVNENSLVFTYHQEADRTVTVDQEINYVDIPAYTDYEDIMDLELLHSNNRVIGYNVENSMIYERDGKNWERKFTRSQLYESSFDETIIEDPKENGFTQVDSLYDL